MTTGTDNKPQGSATYTPPRLLLVWSWVILALLLVVFAKDIRSWAIAAETPLQEKLLPASEVLADAAEDAGVAPVREGVQGAVQGIYAGSPALGEVKQPGQIASAPEQQTASNVPADESVPAVEPPFGAAAAEGVPSASAAQDEQPGLPAPKRFLLVGDSSIQSGLGTELERRLEELEGVTVLRFGLHSTGLARPDYFDWYAKLEELQAEFEPDVTIAYWGDNDCQGLSTIEGQFITRFGSDEWKETYGQRYEDIIALMKEDGGEAVIIGMPIMRSRKFRNQIEILNEVTEQATDNAGGTYLPTWGITSDDEGEYMATVEFEGKERMIRAGDGIHLSKHGSDYVAYHIIEMLREYFTLVDKE